MSDDEFNHLATRYFEGALDENDRRSLEGELLDSPDRVRQFNDLRMLAGLILEHGRWGSDLPQVVEIPQPGLRWNRWLAAAAVLTLGVAAGWLLNRTDRSPDPAVETLSLIDLDFEQAIPGSGGGIPIAPGRWGGDPVELASAENSDVIPRIGDAMACFALPPELAPKPAPFAPEPRRAVQWRIVELPDARPENAPREAQLRVQFNRDAEVSAPDLACRIELYTFRGPPESAGSQLESEGYLAAAISHFRTDSDPGTWETATSKLEIAPEAEFLLFGISGFAERVPQPSGGEKFSGHYADGVDLKLTNSNKH